MRSEPIVTLVLLLMARGAVMNDTQCNPFIVFSFIIFYLFHQMLLDANAPVSEKDNNENEPIHLAAKAGSEHIIRLLKQYSGNVCSPGKETVINSWFKVFFSSEL